MAINVLDLTDNREIDFMKIKKGNLMRLARGGSIVVFDKFVERDESVSRRAELKVICHDQIYGMVKRTFYLSEEGHILPEYDGSTLEGLSSEKDEIKYYKMIFR